MSAAKKTTKPSAKNSTPSKNKPTAKTKEPKGTGVIASIVEFLQAATAAKPIDKASLLAKLKQRFPGREEIALGRTLNCQVPTRLKKEKKLNVVRTEKGYFIKA